MQATRLAAVLQNKLYIFCCYPTFSYSWLVRLAKRNCDATVMQGREEALRLGFFFKFYGGLLQIRLVVSSLLSGYWFVGR